jgi:hypothetical protein
MASERHSKAPVPWQRSATFHFHDLRGAAVTRLALSGCTAPEIAAITEHSLADVEEILEKHYMGGRIELAESAILKLESRYGENENAEEAGKRLENADPRVESVETER